MGPSSLIIDRSRLSRRSAFRLVTLLVLIGIVVLAAGAAAGPSSALAAQRRSALVEDFSDLSCPTGSWCAAVGHRYRGSSPTFDGSEIWNGHGWSIDPMPKVPGLLAAVSCSAPETCTAVGGNLLSNSLDVPTTILRLDGGHWSQEHGANARPPVFLFSVSCPTSRDCMVVGVESKVNDNFGDAQAFAEIWNGAKWRALPVPVPATVADTELNDISCSSPDACTAIGDGQHPNRLLIEHWDGRRWSRQLLTAGVYSSEWVSCPSSSFCLASALLAPGVGEGDVGVDRVLKWNYGRWATIPSTFGDAELSGDPLSCSSAAACTAVGVHGVGNVLVKRWNGHRWSNQHLARNTGRDFDPEAISCGSNRSCTLVGDVAFASAIEHWDGKVWQRQPTP